MKLLISTLDRNKFNHLPIHNSLGCSPAKHQKLCIYKVFSTIFFFYPIEIVKTTFVLNTRLPRVDSQI